MVAVTDHYEVLVKVIITPCNLDLENETEDLSGHHCLFPVSSGKITQVSCGAGIRASLLKVVE